ncbi:MAG TPA: hypothetical protein VIO39_03745 [Methylotenera sp.]
MIKIFTDPILAKCKNRSELAKENPILGGPDIWFNGNLLEKIGIKSVGFDFFIDWSNNILDRNLWLKRLTLANIDVHSLSDNEIINSLKEDKFLDLVLFSRANKFTASAIIYNDNQNWSDQSHLIHVFWPKDATNNKGLRVDKIYLKDIKQLIKAKSGGPVKMGTKGLTYGTSRLECSLCHSDALWPGDADLILLNNNYLPIAVLEFKKHTASSGIPFNEQRLGNYYPSPDGRKYDRLKHLSDQINGDVSIPLFLIYYSTISTEHRVIVEQVIGNVGALQAIGSVFFTIDENDINGSFEKVIQYIINNSKLA